MTTVPNRRSNNLTSKKPTSRNKSLKIENKIEIPIEVKDIKVEVDNWNDENLNTENNVTQHEESENMLTVSADIFNQFFNTANQIKKTTCKENVDKEIIKDTVKKSDSTINKTVTPLKVEEPIAKIKVVHESNLLLDINKTINKLTNRDVRVVPTLGYSRKIITSENKVANNSNSLTNAPHTVIPTIRKSSNHGSALKKKENTFKNNYIQIHHEMGPAQYKNPVLIIDDESIIENEANNMNSDKIPTKFDPKKNQLISQSGVNIPVNSLHKKVLIFSNKSKKLVTLTPKNPPVILHKDNLSHKTKSEVNQCQSNIQSNKTHKTLNKSKIYINKPEIISPKKSITLNSEFKKSGLKFDMPIYMDRETQTEMTNFKEFGIQTDAYIVSSVHEELPDIANLVEYILDTPKYSSDMDENKKSSLLDMSKNIITKDKSATTRVGNIFNVYNKNHNDLKMQLFNDIKDCLNYDFTGNMPIHNAILDDDIKLLKRQCYILKLRQVSVNIENSVGMTPLQLAIINKCSTQIIDSLLGYGANVDVKDADGNTTLHLVVSHSSDVVLQLLLKNGKGTCNIDKRNDEGLTPLMQAVIELKCPIVEVLLRYGADPNLRDEKSGRTALFHAVESDSDVIMNLLLKYKADPKIRNFFGLCTIDAAKDLETPNKYLFDVDNTMAIAVSSKKRQNSKRVTRSMNTKKLKVAFFPSLKRIGAANSDKN